MSDRVEKASTLSRREFLTRASLAMAGAAAVAVMTRNISTFRRGPTDGVMGDSMFTPRAGSRLRFWGSRLGRFRLR